MPTIQKQVKHYDTRHKEKQRRGVLWDSSASFYGADLINRIKAESAPVQTWLQSAATSFQRAFNTNKFHEKSSQQGKDVGPILQIDNDIDHEITLSTHGKNVTISKNILGVEVYGFFIDNHWNFTALDVLQETSNLDRSLAITNSIDSHYLTTRSFHDSHRSQKFENGTHGSSSFSKVTDGTRAKYWQCSLTFIVFVGIRYQPPHHHVSNILLLLAHVVYGFFCISDI